MDPSWEFQAPQFVDFTKLDTDEDQGVDSFFDVDMESGGRVSQMFSGKVSDEFKEQEHLPSVEEEQEPKELGRREEQEEIRREVAEEVRREMEEEARRQEEQRQEAVNPEPEKPKKVTNLVRSWEGMGVLKHGLVPGKPAKVTPQMAPKPKEKLRVTPGERSRPAASRSGERSRPAEPRNRSLDPAVPAHISKLRQETPSRRSLRQAVEATVENVRNSPRLKPKRLGTNLDVPRRSQYLKTLASPSARGRTRSKSPGSALPQTPDVMKRFKNKLAKGLSKGVEDFKVRKANHFKKDNAPLKTRVQPAVKAPVLTKPSEFKFMTSSRTKESRRRSVSVPDPPNFAAMLRSYNKPAETAVTRELTKPVPFPRAEAEDSRKRRHSEDTAAEDKYRSMAEQITKFQRGTPDRFRSKPRGRSASPHRMRLRSQSPKLTVPKTPQLSTKNRSRPTHTLSQAEREELELEEARKHQFHAKGVGETLPKFKYGEVERKPCTVPEPFNLKIASRPISHPQPVEEQVEPFHSRPVNKRILEGPVGVPERKTVPVIEPESPAFALKQRMATRRPVLEPQVEQDRIVKAKPVPHWGVPVSLPVAAKRATVPAPFSFAERDAEMMSKKEEKIKKVLEEEKAAREFHAQPISKGIENPRLPERKVIPPTQVEPFHLAIDERVETRLNKWQEEISKELESQRNAANFKATEPKVLSMAPFVPKPSEKPLAEISNFTLHTDRRAEERMQFEMEKKKKEVDLEEVKRQREERKKREEEEEVARMRKLAVHKAQPIRGYKGVEIKPSERPLTMPVSPRLSVRSKGNSTFNRTHASNP